MVHEIPFWKLIYYVRAELGDQDLDVVVGQNDKDATIFATAKGVTVEEPFATIADFMFWSIGFGRLAVKLKKAIDEKEAANGQ